ncbi:toxin [Streptomyces sp. NPDC051994]|uniref:toxin n=1 Tax=unclassified Streptomyces TaxID=2593676 RepID=UPI00343E18D0
MKESEKRDPSESSAAQSKRQFKQLRRQCVSRLAGLQINRSDRDILTLKDRLSRKRGRPIHLVPMAIPQHSLNGMWVATPVADFVIYAACATRAHQEHIIAHELGHIMCDHQSVSDMDDGILGQLFPDISPVIVRRVLHRNKYSHRNEQEAEMIASLYCARIDSQHDEPLPLCLDDEVVTRLRMAVSPPHNPDHNSMGI